MGKDQWSTGFVLNDISVTNNGTETISNWQVSIELANNMAFANGWGGSFDVAGNVVIVSNLAYNGTLAPGASVSFGVQGTLSSTYVEPSCIAQ